MENDFVTLDSTEFFSASINSELVCGYDTEVLTIN